MNTFQTLDVEAILNIILEKGSIQLTTAQRKARVEHMRQQIIHHIHSQAIDPKSKSPHPHTYRTGIGRVEVFCGSVQTP